MITPQDHRCVAGVMSGTSLDGVDVVIAHLDGHGKDLCIKKWFGASYSFPDPLYDGLKRAADQEQISVVELSQLNVRLAHEYAHTIKTTIEAGGMSMEQLDLVGCHGQTIRHIPNQEKIAGKMIHSTFQIGDPATMSQILGVPVIGDFRLADMACGGQGAPLVPYFDYVIFTHDQQTRGCLNIGGVANITVLLPSAEIQDVYGFDTGPGNLLMDSLCRQFFNLPYDEGGRIAQSGTVHEPLLSQCLEDAYFTATPPKTTGREYLTSVFLNEFLHQSSQISLEDLVATATALTAASVWKGYETFIQPRCTLDRLIVSGGGAHNQALMDYLKDYFSLSKTPVVIETTDPYGIDADSKEALCFAVLAHETANGIPTSIPSVTGAHRSAVLGKLCMA
ncbi:MAG: anhydro-N-acetylmuramic acid kinase [Bacteroidetes bacterium]|nr:anhydro-N-acetylmuramic acid kinase [Bacteroidota bacterium]